MEIGVAPPLAVGFVAGVTSAASAALLGGGFVVAFLAYSFGGAAGIVGAAALAARQADEGGDPGGRARDVAREEAPSGALHAYAGARSPGR